MSVLGQNEKTILKFEKTILKCAQQRELRVWCSRGVKHNRTVVCYQFEVFCCGIADSMCQMEGFHPKYDFFTKNTKSFNTDKMIGDEQNHA